MNVKLFTAKRQKLESTDAHLRELMVRHGRYFIPANWFYHLWLAQRFTELGFFVTSVEKHPFHHLWEIRLRGSVTAQVDPEILLAKKTREILRDLGHPVPRDYVTVVRNGPYFIVALICQMGTAGRWARTAKCPHPFSMLIRHWFRMQRN
ncbi:MAG: hypothetical protein L0Z50_38315 [Verrucomicrobiales bacterium]|nr:hypothetical protein [Verrucomicrobiales bacterium]